MTITPINPITPVPQVPYPFVVPPVTDITPFSYRDGSTYLDILHGLDRWIVTKLIPYIHTNLEELAQNYLEVANNLINTVNDALTNEEADINSLIVTINGLITEMNTGVTAAQASATAAAGSATDAASSATDAASSATEAAASAAGVTDEYNTWLNSEFKPERFGAVADGATDDSAAFNACIVAATVSGYGRMHLSVNKTYAISQPLTIPSDFDIMGEGHSSKVLWTGSGSMVTLTNQRNVKFHDIWFHASNATGVLFTLSNTFRCSWHSCMIDGEFIGPSGTGAYLNQIGVVLTANAGDNMFYDTDINNFGIGIKTDCIQNGMVGGKFGSNNVGVYGFGGGGFAFNGHIDFVSGVTSTTTVTNIHVQIDGATGVWWFNECWFEGCQTAVQVGNASNGPKQIVFTNCRMASSLKTMDVQTATLVSLFGVSFGNDLLSSTVPQALAIGANAISGVAFVDSTYANSGLNPLAFPQGWFAVVRNAGNNFVYMPQELIIPAGNSVRFVDTAGAVQQAMTGDSANALSVYGLNATAGTQIRLRGHSGKIIAEFAETATPVNQLTISSSDTGNPVQLTATGTDADVTMRLSSRGGGGIQINNGTTIRTGPGDPNTSNIGGASGDIWIRTDTPATANQRLYMCSTAGASGSAAWTALV